MVSLFKGLGGPYVMDDQEIVCYVCGRVTNHWGEHENLISLDLVVDDETGTRWTDFGLHLQRNNPKLFTELMDVLGQLVDYQIREGF
jgi:hypothetical protein